MVNAQSCELNDRRLYETIGRLLNYLANSRSSTNVMAHDDEQQPQSAPSDRLWASTEKILRYVNRTHNLNYLLERRLPGGFAGGAYLVTSSTETSPAVLKWNRDKNFASTVLKAATVIEEAREFHDWPTPRWICSGASPSGYPYVVQEFVAGAEPMPGGTTSSLVELALPFLESRHAGKAPSAANAKDWSAFDHEEVFGDGEGSKHKEVIQNVSATGTAIVKLLTSWTEPWRDVTLSTADLVHGDYQAGNLLTHDGRIVALVDVEGVGKGSRFHDLAQLVVVGIVWGGETEAFVKIGEHAKAHAAPGEWEVCLAARLYPILAFHIDGSQYCGVDPEPPLVTALSFIQSMH